MGDAVRVTSRSGRVLVIGESRADVVADGAGVVDHHGSREVHTHTRRVEVRVPAGTDLIIGTISGPVELLGDLGEVGITTVSGNVTAERVASIDARTKSGRVEVQASAGPVRVKTASASIQVDHAAGETRVASVSGTVQIKEALGLTSVKTVNGKIEVALGAAGPAVVETVSGRVRITVPAGVRPSARLTSVSGKRQVECEVGDDLDITARSVSGDLRVTAHR